MTNRPTIWFRQTPSDLVPIAELPCLMVSDSDQAPTDFFDQIAKAIFRGILTPRTEDGLPITVTDCIEKTKSTRGDARIPKYLGMRTDAFRGLFCSPYQHLRQLRSEEAIRRELANGLARHEHVTKGDLVTWFQSIGLECQFSDPTAIPENTTVPLPSQNLVAAPRIVTHLMNERRGPLDSLIEEAIQQKGLDSAAIWALFQRWANEQKPPLLGLDESGGIKYASTNYGKTLEPDVLSKKALGERVRRRKFKELAR